jgi:hypothetical protein
MKHRWLDWKYALIVIGLAVLALLVMDFNNRMSELKRLSGEQDQVAAQVTSLQSTQDYLQTQMAIATSESSVREWAYQDGHLVQQGDVVVVPVAPAESAPEPTATPQPTRQPESNWHIWLSLFLDRLPSVNAP